MNTIRNFVIIAHIDHGKSTLADRFLELTGTIEARKMHAQYLDTMDIEQERGITIKMQPVRMIYTRTAADTTQTAADDAELLYKDVTYKIRGAVFAARKQLGLGHKEVIYQNALELEFQKIGLAYEKEKVVDVVYDGKKIGVYRPDFVIAGKILIELKALSLIGKKEVNQIRQYLRGTPYKLALLINFGPTEARVERVVYDSARSSFLRLSATSPQLSAAYVLNLIDTPGHVDFTYEVSRSLAAVEGAILLVDATKGIQAQTIANLRLAQKEKLIVVPAVNKIDLPNANPEKTAEELARLLGVHVETISLISAKDGTGVLELLERVIEEVPPPRPRLSVSGPRESVFMRALIFDSKYDAYKGVIVYVRIIDGSVRRGDRIRFAASGAECEVGEAGHFRPHLVPADALGEGEIGYIATGLKDVGICRVGDTIFGNILYPISNIQKAEALPGYKEPRPMVFASFYPSEGDTVNALRDALSKLKLNDAALTFEPETSEALGRGFRCGFLGMLHLEIAKERLRREFGVELVVTTPSVLYKVTLADGTGRDIASAAFLPDASQIREIAEPWVALDIVMPLSYMGSIMELARLFRAVYRDTSYLSQDHLILRFDAPLSEIITAFYDRLKSVSSGYASMNYEFAGYQRGDLVKLDILIAGEREEAFSHIVPRERAEERGRHAVERLKKLIPRQWFAVTLQAAIGGKIIAREDISALRKDVTGYLYGGDYTRKRKLLEKQKRGKKKMKARGRVHIPPDVFLEMLKE